MTKKKHWCSFLGLNIQIPTALLAQACSTIALNERPRRGTWRPDLTHVRANLWLTAPLTQPGPSPTIALAYSAGSRSVSSVSASSRIRVRTRRLKPNFVQKRGKFSVRSIPLRTQLQDQEAV
jgi:hypothetical protein